MYVVYIAAVRSDSDWAACPCGLNGSSLHLKVLSASYEWVAWGVRHLRKLINYGSLVKGKSSVPWLDLQSQKSILSFVIYIFLLIHSQKSKQI